MIRTIITPEQQHISITLPTNFIGKQIEVIAYPINEVIDRQEITDKPLTYFASEQSLAKDWLSPEEDNAWKNL